MTNLFRKKEEKDDEIPMLSTSEPPTLKASASYTNGQAHLLDELRWLNRLLAAQVLRLRRVDFYDRVKNFHDLFIADEEIDALVSAGIFETDALDDGNEKKKNDGEAAGASAKSAPHDQPAGARSAGATCRLAARAIGAAFSSQRV